MAEHDVGTDVNGRLAGATAGPKRGAAEVGAAVPVAAAVDPVRAARDERAGDLATQTECLVTFSAA